LDLTLEDILERRLQTLVFQRGLSQTIQQSRQLIAHGHISVNGQKVSSPSYLVFRDEEDNIAYSLKSPLSDPNHPVAKAANIQPEPVSISEEEENKDE
jgi:small subunit ribosomal protein S4